MALRLVQVNFKARDDSTLGRFWAEALGWGVSSEGPGVTNVEPLGFVWPDPAAVCVDVVTVPDPETVRYRAHLDLTSTSSAASTVDETRAPFPMKAIVTTFIAIVITFVITFGIVRFVTTSIRDGRKIPFVKNISAGGTHIHHLVPGIFLLLATGYMSASLSGWWWRDVI